MLQSAGKENVAVPQSIQDNIFAQANIVHSGATGGQKAWPSLLRKAWRLDPSFME